MYFYFGLVGRYYLIQKMFFTWLGFVCYYFLSLCCCCKSWIRWCRLGRNCCCLRSCEGCPGFVSFRSRWLGYALRESCFKSCLHCIQHYYYLYCCLCFESICGIFEWIGCFGSSWFLCSRGWCCCWICIGRNLYCLWSCVYSFCLFLWRSSDDCCIPCIFWLVRLLFLVLLGSRGLRIRLSLLWILRWILYILYIF